MNKKKKKQQKQNNNRKSGTIKIASTINSKKSIYTNKVKSIDGKRPDKRTCIYYDRNTQKCSNDRCSRTICETSRNCTGYKRREKSAKKTDYRWEDYLPLPQKSGIHDMNMNHDGISKNIGTKVHVGYLHGDGVRRDRRRCIHYDRLRKFCLLLLRKCIGSSRCESYREKG